MQLSYSLICKGNDKCREDFWQVIPSVERLTKGLGMLDPVCVYVVRGRVPLQNTMCCGVTLLF